MPARAQIAENDWRTPGPAWLGPNMVPTQAVKHTACTAGVVTAGSGAGVCAAPFRLARGCPPPGISGDQSGSLSGSMILRPNRFGPLTSPDGSLPAVVSATAAARVVPAQC